METLLEICQAVSDESGISIDSSIVGSTDQATKQLLAMANKLARQIGDAFPWPQLQKQGSITLVASQSTYALAADINWIYHETVWNQDQQWLLYGPYSPQDRQVLESGIIESYPFQRFTVRGITDKKFEIDPTPTSNEANEVLAYEYNSLRPIRPRTWAEGQTVSAVGEYTFYNGNYYTATNTGTTGATAPTHTSSTDSDGTITWEYYSGIYATFEADTDIPVINPQTFSQGLLERFSARHGVAVQPEYESLLQRDIANAKPGKVVSMLRRPRRRYPNAPGSEWAR